MPAIVLEFANGPEEFVLNGAVTGATKIGKMIDAARDTIEYTNKQKDPALTAASWTPAPGSRLASDCLSGVPLRDCSLV